MAGFLPLVCDTGHLLRSGLEVDAFLGRYGPRIREIHLHGVVDGADHRTFTAAEPWFRGILPWLRAFEGVVNIEVFSISEVRELIGVLMRTGVVPERRS